MAQKRTFNSVRKAIIRRTRLFFRKDSNKFLKKATGIIHVGANTGQEAAEYDKYGLKVIWIEPIPDVFNELKSNISGYPRQMAIEGLVSDTENKEYDFHIASNGGASSSILEFDLHKDIWPDVSFEKTIKLHSKTLPSLLTANHLATEDYDVLIMDTQGSELMILQGAIPILKTFKFIKTEVADFEAYKGCGQLKDLTRFMDIHGFGELSRHKTAEHAGGGVLLRYRLQKTPRGLKNGCSRHL